MDLIIEEYGQGVMLICFGGGVITMMGHFLGWVLKMVTWIA